MKYIIESEKLPETFKYPAKYIKFVEDNAFPKVGGWWFIGKNPELVDLAYSVINEKSNKSLIPFAKEDDNGDVACFDGDDKSDDPRVYFFTGQSLENADWEKKFSIKFSEWLEGHI